MARSAGVTARVLEGQVGIALGSGAARGWAHVGVIRALRQRGIHPKIVAGCSAGALVGAFYAADRLEALELWGRRLDRRAVMGLMDLSLRGGVVRAKRLLDTLAPLLPDVEISALPRPFAAVATDLETGQEVWLRQGPLHAALRASLAIPGFVTPLRHLDRWLVDGGLANPVPVSLCRALGADSVIGVDLNTTLLGRRFRGEAPPPPAAAGTAGDFATSQGASPGSIPGLAGVLQMISDLRQRFGAGETPAAGVRPSLYDVISNSLDIMTVRITRSRLAGDPPELLIAPRLGHFGMLDFERAAEGIDEGLQAVARALAGAAREPGSEI